MGNVVTPEFRVSFPSVFEPKKNELSGKDEYSVVALFPKGADMSKLQKAAQEAIVEKFGADKKKWPKNLRSPFRNQGEREKENDDGSKSMPQGYVKDAIFINLKSKNRPGVVNQRVEPILDPSEFYAGCWARASVSCYAYDMKGNAGVSFGLTNIQKVKDGEPLSGRPKPEDDFAPITGSSDSSDASEVSDPFSVS